MATITPANLAYKDKDGDLGEVKSLTDTDVTLLNNALQDIEDLKLAYMPGYVKRDFSNVTQDGKDASVSWGMPDWSAKLNIRSSLPYTVPCDGFIFAKSNPAGSHNYVYVSISYNNKTIELIQIYGFNTTFVSVKKGSVINVTYQTGDYTLDFFPCSGVSNNV